MRFSFAVALLGSASAITQKSTQQMQAEIEAMSMNANMHQIGLREKTLLKTYLEVDMNEYLQNQMDSQLFEGVDEANKSKFIGNFFHFVKCRFQDCGTLVQTGANVNVAGNPTGRQMKVEEDRRNFQAWTSGKGNFVPSRNGRDQEPVDTHAARQQLAQISNAPVNTTQAAAVLVTPSQPEVMAQLKKDAQQELIKPTMLAENQKDGEPMNVQISQVVAK